MGNPYSRSSPYISLPDSPEARNAVNASDVARFSACSVMLLGPTGGGKSSFINTLESYLLNRRTARAPAGRGTGSFTQDIRVLRPMHNGNTVNWTLIDTPGDLFEKMMDAWRRSGEINGPELQTLERELQRHRVGCVIVLLNARLLKDYLELKDASDRPSDRVHHQMRTAERLHQYLARLGVYMHVALTKCDLLPHVDAGLAYNIMVESCHRKVEEITGVPMNQIFPVMSLVDDYQPSQKPRVGKLALFALHAALQAARDAEPRFQQTADELGFETLTE